jgi:hypothetical protein
MRFRNQKGKLACVDDTVVKHVSQVTCSSPGGGENTASGGGSGCSLHGVGETAACDAGHFLQSVGGAAACGGAGVCSLHGEGETTALGGSSGCSLHGEGETAAFGGSSGCSLYGEGGTAAFGGSGGCSLHGHGGTAADGWRGEKPFRAELDKGSHVPSRPLQQIQNH